MVTKVGMYVEANLALHDSFSVGQSMLYQLISKVRYMQRAYKMLAVFLQAVHHK